MTLPAARNEHLVVIMLEPIPLGQEFEIWEPHITIVPWFPVNDSNRLDETLAGAAARHPAFEIEAGVVEQWGKKEKYKVQKIEDDNNSLHNLHLDIFNSLEGKDFPIHQKDFMGGKYTPHIALRNRLQKGAALNAGTSIRVSNFTLIKQARLKGSGRMIKTAVKNYELG